MPALKEYMAYIIGTIILVVTLPMVIGIIKKLNQAGRKK
jgi:hypothetical protein